MSRTVQLGDRLVGDGQEAFLIAELGLNHNGSIEIAKQLIDVAVEAGCDAVKFQKRTPEACTPPAMRDVMRETPWGYMPYLEYRERIEFWRDEFSEIAAHCARRDIAWFASAFDVEALQFLTVFGPPCIKIPSCSLTDRELLKAARKSDIPIMLSTGMSTMRQIYEAVSVVGVENLLLAHCTSAYPCENAELNLRMIDTLRGDFDCPVGYSGHERGLATTLAAVAMGACFVERHITLDRSMWGSDQSASLEPQGLKRLVEDIRAIESAMGDGVKRVYESEREAIKRLRIRDTLGAST